jgi:hypothetical protein
MPTEPRKPRIVISYADADAPEVYFYPILPTPIDATASFCAAIPAQAR